MRGMSDFLRFDRAAGLVIVEPGMTIGQLADLTVAASNGQNWFPAVFPGSANVTVAGAIANDVHGKNHASQGSFCHHIDSLTLLRSDDTIVECSDCNNRELFCATLGGLGLTGIITSAAIKLRKVAGPVLESEDLRCEALAEAFPLFVESAPLGVPVLLV
jgi:FAD/FMN-containing dehydrogenase